MIEVIAIIAGILYVSGVLLLGLSIRKRANQLNQDRLKRILNPKETIAETVAKDWKKVADSWK